MTKAYSTPAVKSFEISVVKNPLNKDSISLNLHSAETGIFSVRIHDVSNKLVFSESMTLKSDQPLLLDISEYSLGLYYLHVENSAGEKQQEKFVVS